MQQRMRALSAATTVLALGMIAPADAAVQLHLLGRPAEVTPAPQIDNGVVLGSPEVIVGQLGCRFISEERRLVIIAPDGPRVQLRADSDEMIVDGRRERLVRPAFMAGERLICPLRPVLQALGCIVTIDDEEKTLDIAVPLESIRVFADDQGARVQVRAPLPIEGALSHITDPDRWYVDLAGARATLEHETAYVNLGAVSRVRWGQFSTNPSIARLVADMRGEVKAVWKPHEDRRGGDLVLGKIDGDEPRIERHVPTIVRLETITPDPDTTIVRVQTSDPVPFEYDVTRKPPRVTVQLPDAAPIMPIAPIAVDSPFVASARLDGTAGEPGATLELEMRQLIHFEVEQTEEPCAVNVIFRRGRLSDRLIVVDAGHGGHDSGARGKTLLEKDVNLDVARQVAAKLMKAGARPVLTRDSDVFVDLYDRPGLANRIGADLFVSIHCNAMPQPNTNYGTETYYYHDRSKCLGLIMQSELVRKLGRRDNGLRWANFCVIRESKMPAVLVELMYLNHDEEHAILMRPETRAAAAEAIFEGLRQYVEGTGTAAERAADTEMGS